MATSPDDPHRELGDKLGPVRSILLGPSPFDAEEELSFRNEATQHGQRLSWAPALGNGAALLALAGIVGNVSSPDTALSALTWPLVAFSVGLATGILAIHLTAEALQTTVDVISKLRRARKLGADILGEALELSVKAKDETGTLTDLAAINAQAAALPSRYQTVVDTMEKMHQDLKHATVKARIAAISNGIAIAAVAIGLATLIAGHATGLIKLEKQNAVSSAPAVPRAASAPPAPPVPPVPAPPAPAPATTASPTQPHSGSSVR